METFYLLSLIALSVLMLLLLAEAVTLVSRAPEWRRRAGAHPMLVRQERRTQSLPYVGKERRHAEPPHPHEIPGQAEEARHTPGGRHVA